MVDDTALGVLKDFAFKEQELPSADHPEIGFITAEHLYDTQFTYEKCGYGDTGQWLLAAIRVDNHAVPGEVKQAYQKINEHAAASASPTGMISRRERREAKETATRQVQEELIASKFRRSRIIPILWDLPGGQLYCGSTSAAAHEALHSLLRESFAVELAPITSGTLAANLLRGEGRDRDYEELRPAALTQPPRERHDQDDAQAASRDDGVPVVPWVAQAIDLKDFLGNEFLLWLWYACETAEGVINVIDARKQKRELFVTLDKSLDMACIWGVHGTQSLRSDQVTRLREAVEALKGGKWPRKAGLILADGESQWELTLQGDRWQVTSARLPEITEATHERQLVDARLDQTMALARALDQLMIAYLRERTGKNWPALKEKLKAWVARRKGS